MTLRLGRYIITSRVLVKFFFFCFLLGIPVGVSIAAHSQGRPMTWLPFVALFIVAERVCQITIVDFKKDNQPS